MLPSEWRIQVKNETGESLNAVIKYKGKEVDSNGALSYGSWSSDIGFTGLANGSVDNSSEVDNTTDLFLAADIEIEVTVGSGTPGGDAIFYFQQRGDGASDWPEDEDGFPLGALTFSATGTQRFTTEV